MDTVSICRCGARWNWLTNKMSSNCEKPCRFVMGKSGEGVPPIPSREFIEGYLMGREDAICQEKEEEK